MAAEASRYPTLIPVPEEIVTARLVLRPFRPGDAPGLLAAVDESRAELDVWMEWPPNLRTLADCEDLIARRAAQRLLRTDLMLGVFDRATGEVLGGTGYHGPDWTLRAFEIGYWLRTSATGHGVMTAAVTALTASAFEEMGARRVSVWCDARNGPSRRVAERCGYRLEGTLRNEALGPDGSVRDSLVFALTDADWAARRAGGELAGG